MNVMMGDLYDARSAGIEPGRLTPYVIKAMAEVDIGISANRAKSIDEFANQEFDFIVTVCDNADEVCPWFPGAKDQIRDWLVETFPC